MAKPMVVCLDGSCKAKFEVTQYSALLSTYTAQPWFSWLQAVCPSQHSSTYYFGGEWQQWLQLCRQANVPVTTEKFPPPDVVEYYDKIFHTNYSQPENELTPRQEGYVRWFRHLLENCDIMTEVGAA